MRTARDWRIGSSGEPYRLRYGFLEVLMPSLTLKNLPEELLAALRAAAARDRRSVTQEIIHLLHRAPGRPASGPRRGGHGGPDRRVAQTGRQVDIGRRSRN
jgi:hypothetical protein